MPVYRYHCRHCGSRFERRYPVGERDSAVCECGQGAERVFTPSMVNVPDDFAAVSASDLGMSLEECRAKEKEFANLPSQPSRPSFEQVLKGELDARGIRHPNKLTDAKTGYDRSCLKVEDAV